MKTRMKTVMLGAMLVILLTAGAGYADLSDGLVAYWSFDNAGDPGHDDSGNGNNGTVHEAVPTSGNVGNALWFDGYNDFVDLGHGPALAPETFSLSAWFNTSLPGTIYYQVIYGLSYGAGSCPEFDIRVWNTSVLTLKVRNQKLYGVTPVADGKWHHVVAMREGSVGKIFLDGNLEVESSSMSLDMSGDVDNTRSLPYYIGATYEQADSDPPGYEFQGSIDEVRLYNRALSESEIQELAGAAPQTPAEQIREILNFVYDSVAAGTLVGVGSGNSAKGKLNAFINQLEQSQSFIGAELLSEACLQLQDAYKKCDGLSSPADTVTGSAAAELAEKINKLILAVCDDHEVELDALAALPLVVGQPVTVSGTVYQNGAPCSNLTFGVHDGIRQMSYMLSTNSEGRFSFTSTPLTAQVAIVEYLFDSQIISTSYDIVGTTGITSPLASAIQIQNATSSTYSAVVTSPFGDTLTYTILPGETKELVRTRESIFTFHPTKYGGVTHSFGIPLVGGGSISATRDNDGVVKTTVTGGTLWYLRFSVYGTSKLDYGACWSPGGELGANWAASGFDICVGSDGFSVGGGGSLGFMKGGFKIQLLQW